MAKTGQTNQFIAIKSMFEQGNVQRMKDIEKIFPTAMAIAMGMNHGRYISCLYHPEELRGKEILRFASLISVDSRIVWNIIAKQVENQKIVRPTKSAPKKKAKQ
jgi:hypothetical protein